MDLLWNMGLLDRRIVLDYWDNSGLYPENPTVSEIYVNMRHVGVLPTGTSGGLPILDSGTLSPLLMRREPAGAARRRPAPSPRKDGPAERGEVGTAYDRGAAAHGTCRTARPPPDADPRDRRREQRE
ncbi:hypothetical protein GCM10010156_61960 [Planobispora rosea]|uniref:Uncharacterized protein n=1 Tax=Planobispora rosea TaxID=35762 RepID=A0A8J3S671_PLARO|nr:hypothetical protein GCM10010156_61960 [Planobispora rosea]GIH87539.1 hypothetical protein Pro02_59470 [Planobispora rosea]